MLVAAGVSGGLESLLDALERLPKQPIGSWSNQAVQFADEVLLALTDPRGRLSAVVAQAEARAGRRAGFEVRTLLGD